MAEAETLVSDPEVTGYVLRLDPEEASDLYAFLIAENGTLSEARLDNPLVYGISDALEVVGF